MTIAIDIRPLQRGAGGVYEYTLNIVRALLAAETHHSYVLFSSSWKKKSDATLIPETGPHHTTLSLKYPSKAFNASQILFGRPFFDDLIFAHTGKRPDRFFLPNINFFSTRRNVPIILTVHDLSYTHYSTLLSRKSALWRTAVLPRAFMKKVNHFLAVSEWTKRDIHHTLGIQEDSITVTYLNSDPSFEESTDSADHNSSKKIFLLFGAHEQRKNALCALRAFSLFLKRYRGKGDYFLVLTGNHRILQSMFAAEIKKNGIESHVQLRATVSKKDRIALYRKAAALLYPSLYEGFGLPLVEAARMGVPTIAGASSSIGEVMATGTLLVDPYNINEMAEALIALVASPVLGGHIIERAQAKVCDYSWIKAAQQTREVFEQFEGVSPCYKLQATS